MLERVQVPKKSMLESIKEGDLGEIPVVKGIAMIVLVLLVLFSACKSYFTVDSGEVGVVFNTFTGSTRALTQGTWGKVPWVESVYDFDIRTQNKKVHAESSSKDLQKVDIEVVVNYRLEAAKVNTLFVEIGKDYYNVVVLPTVNEAVKAATAKLAVENIIVERESLKKDIEVLLKERFAKYYIILEAVNLTNITFSREFNTVVEQKQIEEQKIKTAQYVRLQAEENKKKTILDAEAEARKQQLLSQTVTRDVIQLKWIEAWEKGGSKVPNFVSGNGASNFILNTKME